VESCAFAFYKVRVCVLQLRFAQMASATNDAVAPNTQIEETDTPKHGDVHQDVEIGAEAVDIEKVEKVYE
jgi:hypothetical protein